MPAAASVGASFGSENLNVTGTPTVAGAVVPNVAVGAKFAISIVLVASPLPPSLPNTRTRIASGPESATQIAGILTVPVETEPAYEVPSPRSQTPSSLKS